MLAATVARSAYGPAEPLVERHTSNPDSLEALSVHTRATAVGDAALARRLLGAAGGDGVFAQTFPEKPEGG